MLNQRRFIEQIDLLSKYFMVDVPWQGQGQELWKQFKDKDQGTWDKVIDQVMIDWKPTYAEKFPCGATLQQFYEVNLSDKDQPEFPTMEDLQRQGKQAEKYFRLIEGLRTGKIRIDDPRVLRCLKQQGSNPTYKRFNPEKRCFEKI